MRHRPVRGPRRYAAVASVLVFGVVGLAGCTADRASSNPTSTTIRVLQMNLCNSGRADCYSGGSAVGMAETLINRDLPDLVTLNEVCRDDVGVLEQAMSATSRGAEIATAFRAAEYGLTHAPVRCENGQQFGDAVLALVPSPTHGFRSRGDVYPAQDPNDSESRVWVCIDLAAQFSVCTTHTASTSTATALAQCRYLLSSVVPRGARRDGGDRIILGADLNLAASGAPSAQSCLPQGYQRTDDDALQHVVVSPGIEVRSRSVIDMHGTTDHPGLLVDVVLSRD